MANETSIVVSNDFEYNGVLSPDVLFKPSVETPNIGTIVGEVIANIQYKTQLNLSPVLSNIVKAVSQTGECALPLADGVQFSNREVEVSELGFRLPFCKKDFENALNKHLAQEYLKTGISSFDIMGTRLEEWSMNLIEDALRRDVFRIFSFADTTSGSADYSMLDGLWSTIIAGDGTLTAQKGTKFTAILAAGDALASLKAMYEGASATLDQVPENEKKFFVTRSVYDNLVSSYESVSTGSDLQVGYQQDGIAVVRYRGIEVVKISAWDQFLLDVNNPLNGVVYPHLALYTTPANHAVAVDGEKHLSEVEGFFSKDDNKVYFQSDFKMGYNIIHPDLTVYNIGAAVV